RRPTRMLRFFWPHEPIYAPVVCTDVHHAAEDTPQPTQGSMLILNQRRPKMSISDEKQSLGHVRRVVTGHDAQGRAVIIEDGPAPTVRTDPNRPGYAVTQIWATDSSPAFVGNDDDPTLRPMTLTPPAGG